MEFELIAGHRYRTYPGSPLSFVFIREDSTHCYFKDVQSTDPAFPIIDFIQNFAGEIPFEKHYVHEQFVPIR